MAGCQNRIFCAAKSTLMEESPGFYAYHTQLNTRLRPNAICAGAANSSICSNYGTARRPVGPDRPNAIKDPVLVQRSYISSGCPPSRLQDQYESFDDPVVWNNPNRVNTNSERNFNFHTRNFITSVASVQEQPVDRYFMFPKNWSDGFAGMNALGGNISEREVARCELNSPYRLFQNSNISRGSYGSYGTAFVK